MVRMFAVNEIRKTTELSGSLWEFSPCMGELAGKTYPVVVPCCWESLPEFSAYRGIGVFKKQFQAKGTIRLIFKGVSHTARIVVDGNTVGTHYNAFTPFSVIVKDLEPGTHTLEVYADNRFSPESALHVPNDYMSYGGVSRGVVLEELQDAFVESIQAVPVKTEDGWNVKAAVKMRSVAKEDKNVHLTVKLDNTVCISQDLVLKAGQEEVLEKELHVGEAEIWSPESPRLYEIAASLSDGKGVFDDLKDRMGFREIRIEGKDILLNGKKLRIKGFCRHEDHPMYACALPLAAMEQDLQIMKDLGANAVRTSHYPNDELFLDLCDEQGVLVWEENHARGLSLEQMQNPHFEEQAETCIEEMIPAHINHPSIIIWGILNECASETEYGYECYKKQYDLIRSLDDSRPRSSASCKFKTDICFGQAEIVSYNTYPEW